MPPAAIPSSVPSSSGIAPARPRACRRRSSSSVECGGNFGARPKPPQRSSNCPRRTRSASSSSPSTSGSAEGAVSALRRSAPTRVSAWRATSSRRSRYASATATSTCRKAGIPRRGSGGKYVPPKNGSPSGVAKTVIGQPPWPVRATTASM